MRQALIVAFAEMLHGEDIYGCHESGFSEEDAPHYQALNVQRVLSQPEERRTLEIRRLRAQGSVNEFIRIGEMFQARIQYLRDTFPSSVVEFVPGAPIAPGSYNQKEMLAELCAYLNMAGIMDVSPYAALLERNVKERHD